MKGKVTTTSAGRSEVGLRVEAVGWTLGLDGLAVEGNPVGRIVGAADGFVGRTVGVVEGFRVGEMDGPEGLAVGFEVGESVGEIVGALEGLRLGAGDEDSNLSRLSRATNATKKYTRFMIQEYDVTK